MPTQPTLSLVVPAYNEQGRLGPTLRDVAEYFRARGRPVEVIVVDDGSRDGTSQLVQEISQRYPEVRLIRLAANRGKGHAVRSGVVNAVGDKVLFLDADGATPIAEVERLEAVVDQGSDGAIGSRAVAAAGVRVDARFYRRIIGRAFHLLVSSLTVKGYHDTQCGFKMFRAAVAHDLFSRMRMDGFSFDVEILLMAKYRGYRIAEVPVNWTHQPGSRVNLVFDSLRMMRDLFIMRYHMMAGDYEVPHLAPLMTGPDPKNPLGPGSLPRTRLADGL